MINLDQSLQEFKRSVGHLSEYDQARAVAAFAYLRRARTGVEPIWTSEIMKAERELERLLGDR